MQKRPTALFGPIRVRYYDRHGVSAVPHQPDQNELTQLAHHVDALADHIGYETAAMFAARHGTIWTQMAERGIDPRELAHLLTKLVLDLAFDPVYRGEAELPEEFIVQFKQIFLHLGYTLQERP